MEFIWEHFPRGNVEQIAEHGLTVEDVERVLLHPVGWDISQTSGSPIYFGYTNDGTFIAVVYDWVDEETAYLVTA